MRQSKKNPHQRQIDTIHDMGYCVSTRIESRIGPYTIATARLWLSNPHKIIPDIVGYGIARKSGNDLEDEAIGKQRAIGRALTAAMCKAADPDNEAGTLSQIDPFMA